MSVEASELEALSLEDCRVEVGQGCLAVSMHRQVGTNFRHWMRIELRPTGQDVSLEDLERLLMNLIHAPAQCGADSSGSEKGRPVTVAIRTSVGEDGRWRAEYVLPAAAGPDDPGRGR